jgi:hypothetical protein
MRVYYLEQTGVNSHNAFMIVVLLEQGSWRSKLFSFGIKRVSRWMAVERKLQLNAMECVG